MSMDVQSSLTYLSDLPRYDTEKLYEIWQEIIPIGIQRTNTEFTEYDNVVIHDARVDRNFFDLETTGFTWIDHASTIELIGSDLDSGGEPARLEQYLLECVNLVKQTLNVDRAICFDWRYRKSKPKIKQNQVFDEAPPDREQALNVSHIVHSDDSQAGGLLKLERYLTRAELGDFWSGRWRIRFLNIWRPLVDVVEDAPLTLCDRRSVNTTDYLECDKVHDDYQGENNYLKFDEAQKWYYLSQQTRNEPLLFITWDSDAAGLIHPGGPPHTSFANPAARADAPKRESIEVRVMIFDEKDM